MARREKRVDTALRTRAIDTYLPLVPRERQWHDRRKVIDWPLFPGYVFARFPLNEIVSVLSTPGVATIVHIGRQPTPIPDEDIENIGRFAAGLALDGGEPRRVFFEEGQPVRIVEGPFAGVDGIVADRHGGARVVVGIKTLGLGFELNVDAQSVQPLQAPMPLSRASVGLSYDG